MSHTDKDDPLWVRATWWRPRHWLCDVSDGTFLIIGHDPRCTMPAEPSRRHASNDPRRGRRVGCRWKPIEARRRTWTPSREDRRVLWHGRFRAHIRDQCRIAMQQHRAGTEVDTPTQRAIRHLYWD